MSDVNVIKLINKIRDACASIGCSKNLDLPQIVVMGEQSSGKSSVLERIVQRDFLPRGSGIITRCPLILELITLDSEKDNCYVEFLHLPHQRFYDFNQVKKEIISETNRIAGTNKGISKNPIHLKIYSVNVLNLTLIDLPGLTKFPLGDQPQDISTQINNLVFDYIAKPSSIILAVTPANVDLANSDSLKLARQVDPTGQRTIAVLTKLDLMDAGTNALNILTEKSFRSLFKLGVIGVVNRSQQDILVDKPMDVAIKSEQLFFENHPSYRAIAEKCGSTYLIKHLNHILIDHIKEKLPDLRSKLSTLIGQTQHELTQYGDPAFVGIMHQGSLILKLLTMFSNEFVSSIDGTSSEMSTKELAGGARIYFIFNSIFGNAIDDIQPCANLSDADIRTAIRNSLGSRCSLFIPEIAFDLLVRPQIKLLETPCLRCVDLVYEELLKICLNTCSNNNKEMARFPKLHTKMIEVVSDLLHEQLLPTTQYIESLISTECAYINTNHPDFPNISDVLLDIQKKYNCKERERDREKKRIKNTSNNRRMIRQRDLVINSQSIAQQNDPVSPLSPSQPYRNPSRSMSISSINSFDTTSSLPLREPFSNLLFGGGSSSNNKSFLSKTEHTAIKPTGLSQLLITGNGGLMTEQQYHVSKTTSISVTSLPNKEINIHDDERDEKIIELIRYLIIAYFNIVQKTIKDIVPKAIMHLMVNFTKETVHNRLVSCLYREDLFKDLLKEDTVIASERERCKRRIIFYS
ncbi:Dynamin central region-domain-containing protein [Cokeromyces recurvatus]|uniref:Dynamin central region-domain-containing protein n=1 Tax=Cokeromyces recurvatus TaxID=90255 RepID=UPI00222092B1|nr:Dynamin central region-domain-containing protein [Cokeromyces recurvatus]KAI7905988.1 Dynamin central region-domain-containing protein [Cokeromyces recurvatus]